ncbi:MAG: hypothetical protein ACK4GQ_04990 [Candidatus Hadarchaeales archaeon]
MKQKGIATVYIVIMAIVVIAVVGAGVYLSIGKGGTPPGGEGGGPSGGEVRTATSIQFTVETKTDTGVDVTTFQVKDIGSSSMKIRAEGTVLGEEFKGILDGALQKMWRYSNGQWEDVSILFPTFWGMFSQQINTYLQYLAEWKGGTWTSPDGKITIRDIVVNPSLPDSLFQPG